MARIPDDQIERLKQEVSLQRLAELNPAQPIDGKKQISFADRDARIMGKKGNFDYGYNG